MGKDTKNPEVQLASRVNGGRRSVEAALANIWAEVLRLPEVDTHANFFEIGGDSLKAMEVISRVREALQVDLPLISFFEDPTVHHLVDVLAGGRSEQEQALTRIWAEVLELQEVDRNANFFEIGGDSLKAMEVISRVNEVLNVDLPLIAFFEDPTIQHLVDVLSAGQESSADKLGKIWADVLHVSQVANDANFFDIGGDSLKVMEVIARVNEVLHVDLPLIAFFEDPTVAHLAQVVDELRVEGTTPPIVRVADRREFPLSHSQQVFWLLEQQNPETGIYNKPRVFRIHGKVDVSVMERSLNELRQRHEILRVRFVAGVNGPVQIVEEGGALQFVFSDLSALEPARRELVAMKLALETVREPLDLANGQVQRARLVRFSEDEFLLCISEHHVVNDGFTGSILLDELGAIYDAFATEAPNPLPPLELHYTDFAAWELQWMQGQRLADEVEHWRSLLRDAPTSLDLPTDFAPAAEADRRGNLRSILLPGELLRRIQQFAQSNGTTQFTIMATALRLLLYRWSGQSDFLLGTTASNRSRSGTERMPGPFVNPLPLRNPVQGAQTASQLLDRERKAVMEAFAHQDCPFAKIVEGVNPERTTNDNPLFNVGLVMENFPEIELKGRNFEAEYLNFDPEVSLLDLRFIAVEKHGGLRLSCEYKSALFAAATVDALLMAYSDLLGAMIATPELAVQKFVLPELLVRQAAASAVARQQSVAITATFTAEPVKEPLKFWLQQLGIPRRVEFAPFNQVYQQLLDSTSLLATNRHGANVVLLRMEDLRATTGSSATDVAASLHSSLEELLEALRAAARRTAVPLLVLIAPASEWAHSHPDLAAAIELEERELIRAARGIQGLQIASSAELLGLYPVTDYADDYNYKISHIPYKPALFTAIASMFARRIYTARHAAIEVVLLDADSTLGAATDEDTRGSLGEFLLAQEQAGVILTACSRQSETELSSRFAGSSGRLGWQNIAASRSEVRAMSEAVKEITDELGLDLNRCVFVTGDPIDAAEVRANCPSVVVAESPLNPRAVAAFLKNFWAFDGGQPVGVQQDALTPPGLLNFIANQLTSVEKIAQAVESAKDVRARTSEAYAPPRSPEEEFLADAWSRLLRVEGPGIHDNFFVLGGHSLMAAQVIARVRQTLGVELPLRAMFEAPTIAQFSELIEAERRARTGMVLPPLRQVDRNAELPLSFSQQRVWFTDQLEPGRPLYNVPATYRLRGPLNVGALEKTINEIVRRHESLRTTFSSKEGQAKQVIAHELRLSLEIADVDGPEAEQREAELRRITRTLAAQPFDLVQGPLIRVKLMRMSEEDHVLMLVVHHIVFDGWSGNLMAGELAALYEAFAQARPSPLPELAIQYADYAVWQREWMQGKVRDRQVDYWRQQLAGAPAVLELPTDRPRAAVQSHQGDICTHVIARELVDRLKIFSQAEGATLFTTLLTGFQLLFSRYSRQEDIVVGSTIAGRNYAELEPIVGFFVNTMAMRTDCSGNPTCRELLQRVKKVTLDAYAHQEIPFEQLVEELQPERSPSHNPIYQVLFGLQNVPKRTFEVSGLSIERASVHQGTSILDMSWFAFETDEGILLRVEYSTDLFEPDTVRSAVGHFENVLNGMTAHPEARIADLDFLGVAEKHRVIVEFNATDVKYPHGLCLHELFERHAERTPDAIACEFGSKQITYRALNERANQLAHFLQRLGAAPGHRVGICVERSLEMMVGLLGVQKSGAAYVPLDPAYPAERLRLTMEDAQLPWLLTQQSLLAAMPEHTAHVACLDSDWSLIALESATNPQSGVRPDDPVYVIFTSGSTGRPKGVQVPHRAVVNLLTFMGRELQMGPDDVFPALASFAFDMCIPELYLALATGGRVLIAGPDLASNGEELASLLRQAGATIIHATPTTWSLLMEAGYSGKGLKRVIGAEPLPRELCTRLLEADNSLYNFYGPTETTVWSAFHRFRSPDEPIVVGRPLANTQIYLLDKNLQPVPLGVPGEIFIGGDGVTLGYLNRPELTAEKFIRDPFSSRPNARMYRTGDLGRYLRDGRIEFQGRIDNQVKIRGFRIELGEIETVLERHPSVQNCVVVVREDAPGDKRLVAYVVPATAATVSPAALRELVGQHLPDYMTPTAFVQMERLPLSPNGKVDRKALPAPEPSREDTESFVGPRNAVELKLAEIWAEVLRLPEVGVYDNFFRLGGHSLLATQVVSRVRKWLNVELPLRAMFEAPTIADLAVRVEHLQVDHHTLTPMWPVSRDRSLPLSFAQQRLWFLDQLEPNSTFYSIPLKIRLSGSLRMELLATVLNEIVRRHEVLRARFLVKGDLPIQVIADEISIELPVEDLGFLPPSSQEAAIRRMATENALHEFHLDTGPLIHANLLRLDEREHVLLLNVHHIVFDGWSRHILLSELAALYDAYCDGRSSPLPELPLQYADYAVWQQQHLRGEVLERLLSYWKHKLTGAPPTLDLPTDRPRPAIETFRGAVKLVAFPKRLSDEVARTSRHLGSTPFMTLLAAFQSMLKRYSGQDDIVLGAAIANRNHAEVEGMIGFFANTLVLRTSLAGDPSFRELLERVKDTALGAYAHQDLPFERLVEELRPERSLSHNPLFQVLFSLENTPRRSFELRELYIQALFGTAGTSAKVDMAFFLFEAPDGFTARVEYNTDLFDGATIERMLRHYQVLLEGALANPELRLSQLPLLTNDEQLLLLSGWNATQTEYPSQFCLHQWFEQYAARTPDAVACIFDKEHLTYEELNKRANQLAHYLKKRGVGPGQRVGIFVERSLDMMVGLLGIQKSGAAYVPLDPYYPAERIRTILDDAQVPILLTQQALLEALPPHAADVICLDSDWPQIGQESSSNLVCSARPEDLVYVIYTSGSTGKPKGVQVPHRAVVNLLHSMAHELSMGPDDVFPALASFAFDMCIPELYLALVTGGRVVVARREMASNGEELAALLRETGATVVHATPTTWSLLLEAGFTGQGLKRAIGAEPLPRELCSRLLEADSSLYNFYGPTETTVWSAFHHFQSSDEPVVLGRPLANTQIYILDKELQPVPIGVLGEIHIGGDGVTCGYLNLPEPTAEKFIADRFASQANARMYKTGDLGRFLPDGRIEFMGRIDHQVKIRGFRIELGEIETVLARHVAVQDCVVIAREDVAGDKRLVGYVVPAAGRKVNAAELRNWVKERLPEYMVPVAWVEMPSLPLTPNGKVDRKNLPAPEYQRAELAGEYQEARTPAEEVMAGIWAEVLKLDRVGVHDQFFELGGHSLLATQVVSRIRNAFQVELPLRALFETPTVAGLAERVEHVQRERHGLVAPPIVAQPRNQRLPLSFAQQRLWFLDQVEPNNPLYNIPRAIRLIGAFSVAAMESALNGIVERHEILRTTYQAEKGEPFQVVAEECTLSLPVVDLSGLPEAEREIEARRLVQEEVATPFDLARDAIARNIVLKVSEEDHILVMNTHHIASDGWSIGVFMRELTALYKAALHNETLLLPDLPVQYADYAIWQRNWLQGDVLEQQLAYWKKSLEGAPPVLLLPTDRPRPAIPTFRGVTHRFMMPPGLSDDIRTLSRQQGGTPFMTMLAAFQIMILHHTHNPDIVLGTDLANRTNLQTEALIGFFVNLLALRTDLSGDPTFTDLLGRVREVALGAYAHQDVPFDKLVEELQPERNLSHNPLVQVLFVQQNTPRSTEPMPGLQVVPYPLLEQSKFDMAVFVTDTPQGVSVFWLYNPDLFDAITIERMAKLYQLLLEKATSDPTLRLSQLLEALEIDDQTHRASQHKEFQEVGKQKLKNVKRKAVVRE